MVDDERERIPGLCSVETEGPSTMLFSLELLKVGTWKVLSSEEERTDLEGPEIQTSSDLRGSASDEIPAEGKTLRGGECL